MLFKKLKWKLKTKYEKGDCSQSPYLSGFLCIFMDWFSSNPSYKNN